MSIRAFAAAVGAILIIVAAAGLLWGLTISEPSLFGSRTVDCGNALSITPMDGSSKIGGVAGEELAEECSDAALIRRVIFWPIGGIGAIVLAGATLIRPSRQVSTPPTS